MDAVLASHQSHLSEIVGATLAGLHRYTSLEASMDDLLLAAIQEHTGAELAFSIGWQYGAPIAPGAITLNDLYNIIPMNPPISVVQLTREELVVLLEENLERTFSRDPFRQMGGYVKRVRGLHAYIWIENPAGRRIQRLFVGDDAVQPATVYSASFVTMQGAPPEYGRDRHNLPDRAVDAVQNYLAAHRPLAVQPTKSFVEV